MPPVLKFVFIPILVVFLAACQTPGDRVVYKAEKTASYTSLERELEEEVRDLNIEYDNTADPKLREEIRADRNAALRDLDEVKPRVNSEEKVLKAATKNAQKAEENTFKKNRGNTVQVRVDPFGWFQDKEDAKYTKKDGTTGRDDDIRARMAERADRRRQRQG